MENTFDELVKLGVPLTVAIWPFGEGFVLTSTGIIGNKGVLEVRAVPDDEFTSPQAAWDKNVEVSGPYLMMTFTSSKSARNIATMINELADKLDELNPTTEE